MAVNPGDKVLAAQYNSLQGRVSNVLGNGVNNFGYGQPVTSNQVSIGAEVTAARMEALRTDIGKIYTHQTGNSVDGILTEIETGDIIGADQSGTGLTFTGGSYTFDNPDTSQGFNDYLSTMTTLETNRFDIAAGQQEVTPAITSDARTSSWSYVTVVSEFVVSFATSDARRHFFNSGGEIRISGVVNNLSPGSISFERNQGWQEMIQNPGTIKFGHNYVITDTIGATNIQYPQTTSFGNYQLTSNYLTIFRKNSSGAGGIYGTVYDNSFWTIEARQDSGSAIRFRISLTDSGPESGTVQEPVTADITMRYGARRSINAVTVPQPAFTVANSFQ